MSQEDSFEQDGGTQGLTPQVDAQAGTAAPPADHPGGGPRADGPWASHGNAAPSRGPQASDGMAEQHGGVETEATGPDGEQVDPDISDGGQSGQDSGSMS